MKVSDEKPRIELPVWVTKFVMVVNALRDWGALKGLEAIHVDRRDGYSLIDVFGLLLAYFCCNETGLGGLRGFCDRINDDGLNEKLAAILGRIRLPSSASVSRLLGSLGKAEIAKVIEVIGAACGKLPVHPLCMFHDANGKAWTVFDLDAVVTAFRQRALPAGDDLPRPRRREETAAGYPGRKRGETQISSSRLQQAGSGLWVGQSTVAGNATMSEAVAESMAWLLSWCKKNGIDAAQVLIRIDGAGGNEPCAEEVHKAGFKLLARNARYSILKDEAVHQYLQGDVFYEVPSSRAGPTKHAADLGLIPLTLGGSTSMRTIVTRFTSGVTGEKSGAGHVDGKAQYEMFITDLEPEAWPCEDLVCLYFGRAAVENSFARANAELELDRTFSTHGAGQDFVVLVGMLLSNVTAELGARLLKTGNESVPKTQRGARVARHFDDMATPPPPSLATPPPTVEETAPHPVVQSEGVAVLLKNAFEKHPKWQVSGEQVFCPNGVQMRLHRQKQTDRDTTWLSFRAPTNACAACPKRSGCTTVSTASFIKEISVDLGRLVPQQIQRPVTTTPAFAAATQSARLDVPPAVVGVYACLHPLLVVAQLRKAFDAATARVRVIIEVIDPSMRLRLVDLHLADDAGDRQHRRNTFEEHLDWNAAEEKTKVRIEFVGGAALQSLLNNPAHQQAAT
jgi:hypothetical protein